MIWPIIYDKTSKTYKLTDPIKPNEVNVSFIACFCNFDMAIQYLNKLNGIGDANMYSRWAIQQ